MYKTLGADYKHEVVNHEKDEYVHGSVHTNAIEGFWSLLKRQIVVMYHLSICNGIALNLLIVIITEVWHKMKGLLMWWLDVKGG